MVTYELPGEFFKDIPPPSIRVTYDPPYGICDVCGETVRWFQRSMEAEMPDREGCGLHHNTRHLRCHKRAERAAMKKWRHDVFVRVMQGIKITVEPLEGVQEVEK